LTGFRWFRAEEVLGTFSCREKSMNIAHALTPEAPEFSRGAAHFISFPREKILGLGTEITREVMSIHLKQEILTENLALQGGAAQEKKAQIEGVGGNKV
jgi:hypothetical protein